MLGHLVYPGVCVCVCDYNQGKETLKDAGRNEGPKLSACQQSLFTAYISLIFLIGG